MIYLKRCDTTNGCGKTYPGDLHSCPHCGCPEWASDAAQLPPTDYCYDIETFPNAFTCRFIHVATDTRWRFEISDRYPQRAAEFVQFMLQLRSVGARLVGFNSVGFDYPVVHHIMGRPNITVREVYDKAMEIIRGNDKFKHIIWANDCIVEQIDLFKIHHFDNKARSTSLKSLEIAMKMDDVRDLPFEVGTMLDDEQIEVLHDYNDHDVVATCLFYVRSLEQIAFREELTRRYARNFMNHNDTKIGKDYFIMELERNGIPCYEQTPSGKQPRQTIRPSINLGEVIFPYVKFERPEFQRVRDYLAGMTITETKGVFKDLACNFEGLEYKFGTGGLHAADNNRCYYSDDEYVIEMRDVKSYYPNLSIRNRLYPAHFGEKFCDIYEDLYDQRQAAKKAGHDSIQKMLKLALNGTYGDSNNAYSPFYDPKFTMSITINGQMLLCMLVEQLVKVPNLTMINVNTDGVGFIYPRKYLPHIDAVCAWWEQVTKLELERDEYKSFSQRDVNSYIGVGIDGHLKRKGAYEYELQWHQDPSALVVPKAAEAALVRGIDPREFITQHRDPFDFMLRAKVPRSNKLVMRWPEWDIELPMANIIRYFVSRDGGSLVKVAPPMGEPGTWKRASGITDGYYRSVMAELATVDNIPPFGGTPAEIAAHDALFDAIGTPWDERIHTKNKSKHEQREMGIAVGWRVTDCSHAADFDWSAVNYDYYVAEAEKLLTMRG